MRITRTYPEKRCELFDAAYGQSPADRTTTLAKLYNRHIGPLTALRIHRPELGDFSMYTASCEHSAVAALVADAAISSPSLARMRIPGGGKGVGMGGPVSSALGEASERLLAVLHFQGVVDELEFASCDVLERSGRRTLGPQRLPLFAPEQHAGRGFKFAPFRRDTRICWHPAVELLSGEPVWVPAQLALLYYKSRSGEAMIGYPTSGGLGFARTRRRAILHGLYEFMERDAINVRWYCRLAPRQVQIDIGQWLERKWPAQRWRLSTPSMRGIHVQLATIDHPIPIFTITARDECRAERTFVGAGGGGGQRERALVQALFELGQTRAVLNAYRPDGSKLISASSGTSEMTDFLDGTVYYGFEQNRAKLDWYAASEGTIDWSDVPELSFDDEQSEYEAVLDMLKAAGLNPVVIDLGSACGDGSHLVRVIVPELTLASVGACPYLGHPRYYELPCDLGCADRPLSFGELNTDPVPFP